MLPKPSSIAANKPPPASTASSATSSGDARLLHDIETLSRALSLNKPSCSISAPKSHPNPSNPNSKGKKQSFWSTFNPIKSLRSKRRFSCRFSLLVHSIDNLPSPLSSSTLTVRWRRSTDPPTAGLSTHPVRIFDGSAEFDEVLTSSCSVYGSRSGPNGSAKYEARQFVISVAAVDRRDLDLGKNLIDLTRLLPLSLEELDEEEGSSGKWSTSFRLSGKAKGATLNVSFWFWVIGEGDEGLGNGNEKRVGRIGSFGKSRDRSRSLLDVKELHEVLPCSNSEPKLEFEKLEDLKLDRKDGFEVEPKECKESEFKVIEEGTEVADSDRIRKPEPEKIEFEDEEGVDELEKNKGVGITTKCQISEYGDLESIGKERDTSHVHEEVGEKKPGIQLDASEQAFEGQMFDDLYTAIGGQSFLEWEEKMESMSKTSDKMKVGSAKKSKEQ